MEEPFASQPLSESPRTDGQSADGQSADGQSADGQSPLSEKRWELYRLLSDPIRLRLLALTSREELAVGELAELLHEGQPKVSRQATALRDAGLLQSRKQGTWRLLRVAPGATTDPVVADALSTGIALCNADGTLERIARVVASRDEATRQFFARKNHPVEVGIPEELPAYLRSLSPLIRPNALAVDAGTGRGVLLEALSPLFQRVVAVDRSQTQLDQARARADRRGFDNIDFVLGELSGPELKKAVKRWAPAGADAVFAARVLHHAAVPSQVLKALVQLARRPKGAASGGAVIVVDYEDHLDTGLQEQQADVWPGFSAAELERLAEEAGLCDIERGRIPKPWSGTGPDGHLRWQWLAGRRGATRRTPRNE